MPSQSLIVMYQAKPAARKLFDTILQDGVADNRTTVDELIEAGDVSRQQAITLLRDLDEAGYGEFKVGRKGYPSRLEWRRDPRALAERVLNGEEVPSAAAVASIDGERTDDGTPDERVSVNSHPGGELFEGMFPAHQDSNQNPAATREVESIQHSYVLRRGLRVVVDLPEDLSAREAEILGDWIRNLSFER